MAIINGLAPSSFLVRVTDVIGDFSEAVTVAEIITLSPDFGDSILRLKLVTIGSDVSGFGFSLHAKTKSAAKKQKNKL